jgi:hypothetical protein
MVTMSISDDPWLARLVHKLDRLEEAGRLRTVLKRDPHTLAVRQLIVTPQRPLRDGSAQPQ